MTDSVSRITTIMPTYRRPRLLARAMRSVLAQTYPNLELHVFDNASGDETEAVVSEFARSDARVFYHRRDRNIGALRNFADSLEEVRTPFFHFLSDDDVIFPHFFELAMSELARHPEAMLFSGSCAWVEEPSGTIRDIPGLRLPEGVLHPPRGFFVLAGEGQVDWMGTVFRRELIDSVGGLDIRGDAFDLEFVSRCAASHPWLLSRTPCAIYTIEERTYSVSHWSLEWYWSGVKYPIEKYLRLHPQDVAGRRQIDALVRRHARRIVLSGVGAAVSGAVDKAREGAEVLDAAGMPGARIVRAVAGPGRSAEVLRWGLGRIYALRSAILRGKRRRHYQRFQPEVDRARAEPTW